ILSICANSASCKHLFSLLRLILTKLCSRLGLKTLTSIAELKMHLCDEHLKNGAKQCLKRHFSAKTKGKDSLSVSTTVPPVEHTPAVSTNSATAAVPAPVPAAQCVFNNALGLAIDSSAPHRPPLESEDDNTDGSGLASVTSNVHPIRELANTFMDMASCDDMDSLDSSDYPSKISCTIADLFNFNQEYWASSSCASAEHGLREKLELYDLLDADGEGDPDDYFELDASTESILTS
ncbi:hypothetical protein NEOLEDRAFT_1070273, partial [Neolentinus lepideus HHB14362 ss-1]